MNDDRIAVQRHDPVAERESAPLVSVVIPAYNQAHFLGAAIDSALGQTHPAIEVIVVDDGATDATPSVAAGYADRIRYVRQANAGLAAARNTGLWLAHGDYVGFLDADDEWLPDAVAMLAARLDADPRLDVAYGEWENVDAAGRRLAELGRDGPGDHPLRRLVLGNRFPVIAALVRRPALDAVGGFDASLAALEDWDLWLRVAASGMRFACVPRVVARYRRHTANMSLDVDRMERNQLAVLDKFARSAAAGPVADLLPEAVATVHLGSAVVHAGQARAEDSYRSFAAAVDAWPPIAARVATWYRLACADQAPGYRGAPGRGELDGALDRITGLLERAQGDPAVRPRVAPRRTVIERSAARALAQLGYIAGDRLAAWRRALRFGRRHPAALLDAQMWAWLVRALVGPRRVAALKRRLRPSVEVA